jgi:PPOX class probable F420-dependent enzyme
MRAQRRGRRIAMTPEEVDDFLAQERTCRVATVNGDGSPHVSPLWFVWIDGALWLNSVVKSQRWVNLQRDPRISVIVDGGEAFTELRGVEMIGEASPVADVPRSATPDESVRAVEEHYGQKYLAGPFVADGAHAWVRLVPTKVVSWDFRKMG